MGHPVVFDAFIIVTQLLVFILLANQFTVTVYKGLNSNFVVKLLIQLLSYITNFVVLHLLAFSYA